jgi:hypothetical protein
VLVAQEHKDLAARFDIKGFPTIKLYSKKNKSGIEARHATTVEYAFEMILSERVLFDCSALIAFALYVCSMCVHVCVCAC